MGEDRQSADKKMHQAVYEWQVLCRELRWRDVILWNILHGWVREELLEGVTLTVNDVLEPVTQKRERGIQAEIELVQGELNMVHV